MSSFRDACCRVWWVIEALSIDIAATEERPLRHLMLAGCLLLLHCHLLLHKFFVCGGARWSFSCGLERRRMMMTVLDVLGYGLHDFRWVYLVQNLGFCLRFNYAVQCRAPNLICHTGLLRFNSDVVWEDDRSLVAHRKFLLVFTAFIQLLFVLNCRQLVLLTTSLLKLIAATTHHSLILLLVSFRFWKRVLVLGLLRRVVDSDV